MTKKSDEFEQMIAKVHELLEGQDAHVEWNERIADPDNPKQLRQIDVSVRKDNLLNLIQCRIHKRKQDVNWIEELIGRRSSLQADTVIAVSSSGFTSGAIKKAAKYGVVLQDLLNLSNDEIESWSRAIKVSIFFYKYEEFKVFIFFDSQEFKSLSMEVVSSEFKNYYGLRSIFTAPLEIIDSKNLIVKENRNNKVNFGVRFVIDRFYLQGTKVKEIEVKGKAVLEQIDLNVPVTLAYGSPKVGAEKRDVYIQKFNLGQTQVIHHKGSVSVCLDLSKLDVPPYWQFRYVEVTANHQSYTAEFEVIAPERIIMKVDKCDLTIGAITPQQEYQGGRHF